MDTLLNEKSLQSSFSVLLEFAKGKHNIHLKQNVSTLTAIASKALTLCQIPEQLHPSTLLHLQKPARPHRHRLSESRKEGRTPKF